MTPWQRPPLSRCRRVAEVEELAGQALLLFLQVVLGLLKLVDLVALLGEGISALLAESAGGGLVINVDLFEIAVGFEQFTLARLVEGGLGSGGATGVLKTLGELIQPLGEVGPPLLALNTGLTLGFQFPFDLFVAGGSVLDLPLGAGNGRILVLVLTASPTKQCPIDFDVTLLAVFMICPYTFSTN